MSSDTLALLIAIAVFAAIALIVYLKRPKRVAMSRGAQDRREAEAKRRGWTFEVTGTGDDARCVYAGTTDFIPWRCELRAREVSETLDQGSVQRASTRWWTDTVRLAQGVVIVTPASVTAELIPAGIPAAMLAKLAPFLAMLGIDPRDASLVSSAALVEDRGLPGYRLRATDPVVLGSLLDGGARAALADAAPWLTSGPHQLLVVSLGTRGLTIVVEGWVEDLDLVERLADVGSRLAAARGQ